MSLAKISDETIKQIHDLIAEGTPQKYAAQLIDISEVTFHNWYNKGKLLTQQIDNKEVKRNSLTENEKLYIKFFKSVKKAHAKHVQKLTKNIQYAGESEKHWQANAWMLERRYPEVFGRKEHIVQETKLSIETDLSKLSTEELIKIQNGLD